MICKDKNALMCDFAETYHIYDYRQLPARQAAAFAVGLRANSRIKMKFSEEPETRDIILLAHIVDRLTAIIYGLSSDEKKGDMPSMVDELYGIERKARSDIKAFKTGEEFDKAWNNGKGGE